MFGRHKGWGIGAPAVRAVHPSGTNKLDLPAKRSVTEGGEVLKMKRIRMLFTVSAVAVAMLVATTLPAMAKSSADSTVFFPHGNGITYSCTGGAPFVVDPMSGNGNCALQQIGPLPEGVVCDSPTTITFVHDMHQEDQEGMLCQ